MSENHVGNDSAVKWTAEHDAMLRNLRGKGISSAQIGVHLNCEFSTEYTRNAVIGRCHRLGLTAQRPPVVPKQARMYVPGNASVKSIPARRYEAKPLHIPLLELEPGECRWPYGDGVASSPYLFCGCQTFGLSYCPAHVRLSVRRETA
jgi:GcrA cell cycle regulator